MSQSKPHYLQDIPADWQATLAFGNSKSQSSGWRNKTLTLDHLVDGLTQHKIGPKDGLCFLQGTAKGGTRHANAMESLFVVGIDVDNGMPSEEIDRTVRERGLFAVRYTTHSHGKGTTPVKKTDWVKYQRSNEGATIAEYLVAKKHYLPEIASQTKIVGEELTGDSGIIVQVSHPPMDKNRLIFVLAKPWSVWDHETQEDGFQAWREAYMNFAAWLGIAVDKSCTDTSRLLYTPRREADALYEAVVHKGAAVDIFALPKTSLSRRAADNVFLDAAQAMGADVNGLGAFRAWAGKYSQRFLIADALQEHAPNVLRPEADRESKRHIECPFESGHTSFGGSGTFCVNAGESNGGGFVVKCMHGSCVERDRLDFVCEMVKLEWLPEEALTDGSFLLEVEEDAEAEAPPADTQWPLRAEPPKPAAARIALPDVKDADGADLFVRALAESDASPIKAAEEISRLARHLDENRIRLGRTELQAAYRAHLKEVKRARRDAEEAAEKRSRQAERAKKDDEKDKTKVDKALARDKRRREAAEAEANRVSIFVDTDHLKSVTAAMKALEDRNNRAPYIFRNAGSLARISWDEMGFPRVERMGPDQLTFELARVTRYLEEKGESFREVPPTQPVVKDILSNPEPPFPVLSGVVTAPVFGPDGEISTKPGYDPSSQLYFEPAGDLRIPQVPQVPSEAAVGRALDLLLGNALVDFPFDGPNGGASERAHALCMVLQPFARQLIAGATPIYLIVKPTPGTGASKLVNIYSLISTGEEAIAQTETRQEDEIRKRITSVLLEASPTFYLDNINYRIDSSALASAVTAPMWTDRMLGETKTVRVPVKHTWIFAGNNPVLSNEIARRCVRIRLDAKVERPELRTAFKHKDLEGWVRANRSDLVWACLTLIQNWIARGRPEGEAIKGSFEPWSRVMGGILGCCGFGGFLANDGELRDASDEEGNAIKALVSAWWNSVEDQPITTGGSGDGLFEIYKDEEIVLPISGNHPDQQKVSFGKYLSRLEDRMFSIEDEAGEKFTVRIEKGGKKNNKVAWRLARAEG